MFWKHSESRQAISHLRKLLGDELGPIPSFSVYVSFVRYDKRMSWLSLATRWTSDKIITDPSLLPILRTLGKMLTSTYVNTRPFSYPIGNTPAANLLRDLRPGKEPVGILALGCGDIRNILFTLWSQKHDTCKLSFTACDLDPAIIGEHSSYSMDFKAPLPKIIMLLRNHPIFRWLNIVDSVRS
jgi:hypothetical protein